MATPHPIDQGTADQSHVVLASAREPVARPPRFDVEASPNLPKECVPYEGYPIPITCKTPWTPPGIVTPWPHDEYLMDGGDREIAANIGPDGDVHGLELEDTVAVYEGYDGQRCIKPSNTVCIYSPRFAAVRQTTSVVQNKQREQLTLVNQPLKPELHQDDQLATTAIQPIMPEGEIGLKQPSLEQSNEAVVPAESLQPIVALQAGFLVHENFLIIRQGIYEASEQARLMEAIDAAIVWSGDQAVQVVLEGQTADEIVGDQRAQVTYRIDTPDHPCLRLIKVASTKFAKPGDVIDFTIRFDNTGDAPIEHVSIIDNLTTRLEYVDGTAQSSREAEFSSTCNQGESSKLRWDFKEPLPVGAGGLVRFHCKVR